MRRCALCDRPTTSRGARYCVEHRDLGREWQRYRSSLFNVARWEEWRAAGIDPTHGGEAARKRGAAIAESNRDRPRRRSMEEPES